MKYIELTKGYKTIVDDEDYEELSKHKWFYSKYAARRDGKKHMLMHRQLMDCPAHPLEIDHINRNKLDNRKSNLRVVTRSENMKNQDFTSRKPTHRVRKVNRRNGPGPYGVYFHKDNKSWYCYVSMQSRKPVYVGSFKTEHQAALAHDLWELYLHPNDPLTNYPIVSSS